MNVCNEANWAIPCPSEISGLLDLELYQMREPLAQSGLKCID
jgi:hypothetical protein